MTTRKLTPVSVRVEGRVGEEITIAPAWVPPIFKRFWRFARDTAKKFTKHLLKDRTDELVKAAIEGVKHG